MDAPIYLDYNATTPVDQRVVDAMLPYFTRHFGNASSAHAYGHEAASAVQQARSRVAGLIGAQPDEIVFTQGGSEGDNLAIKGVVFSRLSERPHVIASAIEHPAVLATLEYLHDRFAVEYDIVPVDQFGLVAPEQVDAAMRPETVLVTIMHANNEIGTLQPLRTVAAIAHQRGALFHVDAAQSVGKIPVDVANFGIDLLTIAGHKLYAPKGIGALYVRRGVTLDPLIHGGTQESGRRAGTENVPYIVGLGQAAALANETLPEEEDRLRNLRDFLHQALASHVEGFILNGHPELRAPGTLNVSFPGVSGQMVLDLTPQVAASTGSACHSGTGEPSGVLRAIGANRERALGAVRLTLGRWSTTEEMQRAADALVAGYAQASAFAGVA